VKKFDRSLRLLLQTVYNCFAIGLHTFGVDNVDFIDGKSLKELALTASGISKTISFVGRSYMRA